VVSEETGTISLVEDGKLEKMANAEELRKALAQRYEVSMDQEAPMRRVPLGERLSGFFSGDSKLNRIFYGKLQKDQGKLPKSGTGS